jgi:hypothetical protein
MHKYGAAVGDQRMNKFAEDVNGKFGGGNVKNRGRRCINYLKTKEQRKDDKNNVRILATYSK